MITHQLSATTPDDPAYEIRPSHWNEEHAQIITLTGNTAGASTISGTNIVFSGGPNATLSVNGNTLVFSGPAAAGGNTGYISGGTTNASLGTLSLADGNGVSFGIDGQTLTASHNGLTSQSNQNVTAGNGGFAFQTLSFSNVNGISFGTSAGSAITASHDGLTSQSNQAFSAAGGSSAFQTLVFTNSNGVSFSNTNGSVWASVETSYAASNHSHGNPTLNLTNVSGTTASNSAGLTLSLSVAAQTAQTGISGVQVSNTTYTSGTLTFQNANGISFGSSGANGISASYTVPTQTVQTQSLIAAVYDGANSISIGTVRFTNANGVSFSINGQTISGSVAAQTNQTIGLYAVSNTTGQSSSSTFDARTLSFHGAGIASVGYSGGSVVISVPAGAPSPVNFSAGTTSGDLGSVIFSNSNGVSFGLNGATITASHNGLTTAAASNHSHGNPQLNLTNLSGTTASNSAGFTLSLSAAAPGGGGANLSGFDPWNGPQLWVISAVGNASMSIRPVDVPAAFQFDRVVMPINYTQSTASTVTMSVSVGWGFFTRNGQTLSLHASGSGSFSVNGSGTASSANNSGNRVISFGDTTTITAGNYYLGLVFRTSSAGGANQTLQAFCASQFASTISGYFGVATNTRMQYHPAGGVWTSTTIAAPNSLALSDIRGNSSAFQRQPIFHFTSGEVTV